MPIRSKRARTDGDDYGRKARPPGSRSGVNKPITIANIFCYFSVFFFFLLFFNSYKSVYIVFSHI